MNVTKPINSKKKSNAVILEWIKDILKETEEQSMGKDCEFNQALKKICLFIYLAQKRF